MMSNTIQSRCQLRVHRLEDRLTPTAGMLDPTFGIGGLVTTPSGGFLNSTTVDSLGRIVVAGYVSNGVNDDFAVARYSPAGKLDTSFGGTGVVTIDFGYNDQACAVAVDSLDRVVVAGNVDYGTVFAVARLTAAGVLDSSFDGDGKQTVGFDIPQNIAKDVAVDSLDRVVVAGGASDGTDFAVARLTVTGVLDNSFDGDGKQIFEYGIDYPYSVAVDSLDRVVVGGFTIYGPFHDFMVVRFTAAGALDSNFNGDGMKTIDFGVDEQAYGVAVDSLDRAVVAGWTWNGSYVFAVARLTDTGALDSSFDGDGKQTIDFAGYDDEALGVAVDSLDRVVVAGYTSNGSNDDFAVARLTAAGTLDSNFDGDGKQTIDLGPNDYVACVAIDSADRVVFAGHSNYSGPPFGLARLTGDTTTAAAQVNDGSAQRSMVTSFKVTFSDAVTFSSGINAAFQLQRTGPGAPTGLVNLNLVQSGNVVTVSFNDSTYAPGTAKSLIDGRYTLTLIASNIQSASGLLDGDLNGTPGGDLVLNLHRLLGDADGNGTVDGMDFSAFRLSFSTNNSIFDFDGSGVVDGLDFGQFRARFGVVI